MSVCLTKENANKITRIDNGDVVVLPKDIFNSGDILVLFNNSDSFITVESNIEKTYVSGYTDIKKYVKCKPRSLVNIIFVDDNLTVFSMGTT